MSRPNNAKSRMFRDEHEYDRRFDIVLAAAFEECEKGNEKFELYEKIAAVARRADRAIFLPHKEIEKDWKPEKVYAVTNEIVIPTSDLMIAYLGLQSTAAGIMMQRAAFNGVPIIAFCESRNLENFYEIRRTIGFWRNISFEDEASGLKNLEKATGDFFSSGR